MTRWYDDDCGAGNLRWLDSLFTPFHELKPSPPYHLLLPAMTDMGEFLTDDLIWKYYLKGNVTTPSQTQGYMAVFNSDADKMHNHWITEYWRFFGLLFQNSQNRLRMTLKEGNGFNPAKGEPMMWNVWNTWSFFGLVCAGGQERLEIVSQEVNILLRQHFPAAEGDKTRQIFSSLWNFLSPNGPWPCIPFESISFLPGSVWDWQDWYYGISTDSGYPFFRQNESWF